MNRPRESRSGVLGTLSTVPERAWPDGLLHHGVRILLLILLAAVATLVSPPDGELRVARYSSGMVADEEILARIPFSVPLTGDELARARAEARASIPVTFDYRPSAADSMAARLDLFFDRLESAAESVNGASAVSRLLSERSIEATPEQLELFLDDASFETMRETALEAVQRLLPQGVADGPDLREVSTSTVTVRDPGGAGERSMDAAAIRSAPDFYAEAVALLPESAPPDLQEILRLLLIQHTEFTYQLNVPATETDRDVAARAVPTTKRDYLQGEAIVRANQQIDTSILEGLNAHESALLDQGILGRTEGGVTNPLPFIGSLLLNALLLSVFGLLVFFFRTEIYTNFRWILLVSLLIGVYFAGEWIVLVNTWPVEAVPIAFVALSVGIIWDGRMALVLVMTLAVMSGLKPGFLGMDAMVPTLIGGAAAGLGVRAVRRRSQTWLFIAIISAAYAVSILVMSLIVPRGGEVILIALGAAVANAILSAIVAMGFLPVYEWFTGITTDQTLLEWADPHRTLLKRLSMEAPGTYAHTINVANLAETAAETIGANGLLCRVGMYYHDVGKMLKPHYFVENQQGGRNPHDRLKPDTSAAIVKAHVTEGLRLAREDGVPQVIVDFIAEHHGTQRIGYFWEKAKEELGEEELDVSDFTYPGPRPHSRETAIAMLADSVESATRALQDPTPERLRDLIEGIVDAKIAEHQLDDAPMTLRELAQVKAQFQTILTGVHHQRIDYPQTRHLTESPRPGAKAAAEVAESETVEKLERSGGQRRKGRSGSSDESQLDLAGEDADRERASTPDGEDR